MLYGWELLTEDEERTIVRGIQDGQVHGGPYHLLLFPTDKCNFDCFFCYTTDLREKARELEWPVLKAALEQGVEMGVKGVSFGGGGESMIYKNLGDLFDFLERHNLTVDSVKTNGSALRDSTSRALVARGLRRITISMNETERERFLAMNRCAPRLFEKAIAGVESIIRAKKEVAASTEISVQIFLWKGNFRHLLEMIETILPLGPDFVYVNSIDGLPPEQRMDGREKDEFKELVIDALDRWAGVLQINLMAEGLQEWATGEQYKRCPQAIELPGICKTSYRIEYCTIGWYCPTIAADGGVYPCCHFVTDETRSYGNLYSNSLQEIWRGDRARRYREEMRHLLLTEADPGLLPRRRCFIHPLCMERTSCAFNYYLASPRVYHEINDWAEEGPRQSYKRKQQMRSAVRRVLRKGKRLAIGLLPGSKDPTP